MRFRIGIHVGEVIEKADGSVYGDGVNIADCWIEIAACKAPMVVSNTDITESPAMSMTRPPCSRMRCRNTARDASRAVTVARSSMAISRE